MTDLDKATHEYCELPVKGGAENVHGKVNILLQTFIFRGRVRSFSLISDMTYITQNAARIARALFEIVLRKNLPLLGHLIHHVNAGHNIKRAAEEIPLVELHGGGGQHPAHHRHSAEGEADHPARLQVE